MRKCRYCGTDLPENSRFCGKCGRDQDALATDAATRSTTPPPSPSRTFEGGTIPATWPPYSTNPPQGSATAWSPLYDAALGGDVMLSSGQASPPGAPFVQGTPQIGGVPTVVGSPTPYLNAPASNPAMGAGNAAPVGHPVQGPAHMPAGNPPPVARNPAPVGHPVQGPGTLPVTHPIHRPQPMPHPTEPPGMQEHHHPHGPHHHHGHPTQHEPDRHRSHFTEHKPHRLARVPKVAGGSSVKTIILVATAVVVVAAGVIVAAAHFIAHPPPSISITSSFTVGATPAGAPGTILHVSGQNFSSDTAITFLLDGHVAPGNAGTRSDSNGNFNTGITITSAWSSGTHTLTAKDTSNNSPQNGVSIAVVHPGQANTPGPDGAPPDDASFRLRVSLQSSDPYVGEPFASNPVLIITGHPDPRGGTVCSPDDDGQSFTHNGTTVNSGAPFTETDTASCTGTYKTGQISYTETDTSVHILWQSNGVNINCVLNNPAVVLQLTGAYAGHNTFSGTINYPYVPYSCDTQNYSFYQEAVQGTWTGTIVTQ